MDRLVQQPGSYVLPPRLDLREEQQRSRQEGSPASRQSAKKGEPWSEEEHRNFISGLQRLGKGRWKEISKYYVPTRTPTQVASHAQKHYLRASGATKRRSRFTSLEEEPTLAIEPAPTPILSPLAGSGRGVPALGQPVTSIAMGVPVGTPPWLLPPISQPAADLQILPVGPIQPTSHGAAATPPSSKDSRGTDSPPCLHSTASYQQRSPPHHQQQGLLGNAAALHVPRPLLPLHGSSRQQQLFRLLEMREQLQAGGGSHAAHGAHLAPLPRPAPNPPASRRDTMRPAMAAGPAGLLPHPAAQRSAGGTRVKQEPVELPGAMVVPGLWGSAPQGLAMLAEAAACSDGKAAADGAAQDADSDADTTLGHSDERHTV